MTCEQQRLRVEELQREHAEAQQGCSEGIRGDCARASNLLRELTGARVDLQNCLHPADPPVRRMTTDVRLDQVDGSFLELEARVVKAIASDFMLDEPSRRRGGGSHRRAMVHNQNDGLTLNFNGDYPGGVTVIGDLTVTGELSLDELQSAIADIQSAEVRLTLLEQTVSSLVTLAGASVIPRWKNKSEVEQGGLIAASATELGLVVQLEFDRLVPEFNHEDVIAIAPPPGSAVRRSSTVVVTINLEG